jgi:excisionase family DNA binding protein
MKCGSTKTETERSYVEPMARMTVSEIAQRLAIGKMAVYRMLDEKIIPAVRVGKRWVVTRKAFAKWEDSCGLPTSSERVQ